MIKQLGEILVEKGIMSLEQLQTCLNIQKRTGQKIGQIIKSSKYASDRDIARAIAEQLGWEYVEEGVRVNEELLKKITLPFARGKRLLPIKGKEKDEIVIVMADPFDTEATETLHELNIWETKSTIATEETIDRLLEQFEEKKEKIETIAGKLKETGIEKGEVNELLNALIEKALSKRATDIHLEPTDITCNVRMRIDGILSPVTSIDADKHGNIVNVIFDRSGVTTSEFIKFQDASFRYDYKGRRVDIRVSSVPAKYGPSVCLRLLDSGKSLIMFENLGFNESLKQRVMQSLKIPNGIFLITGPTGSGKTTTLYALLKILNNPKVKIITIEDPIEIEMPGIQQCEINEKAGISFAVATRSFLRHDPDIMLIGEIRDTETAKEAIRASITGHKVFSTLHTNTAAESILRLLDLGVEISYIINSIVCIISQRLVRKLCHNCKVKSSGDTPYTASKSGCELCEYTGYKDRTVVGEVMRITDKIKEKLMEQKYSEIETIAREDYGFKTLKEDGLRLAKEGLTSLEEIERVIG